VDTGEPACDIGAMEITRAAFTVHSFDADAFGDLAPAALAGYLQEAAGRSAAALGWSLAELNRRGLTWVLVREQMVLDEPLRMGDTLEVETWPAGLDRLAALRDFRILRGGVEVGRALTTWLALDLATRRPVRPATIMPERFHAQTPHLLPVGATPLAGLGEASIDRRFQVRFADIDANLHVTHASYVAWALEAVDEETWRQERVAALDVQFLAECRLGAFVRSRSAPEAGGVRLHAIVREEDGRELARARTTWVERDR
jgi:acyl-ACP thioesterase